MDIGKYLIYLKGEEKTKDIETFEKGELFKVKFITGKSVYSYKKDDVRYYENPENICHEKTIIYLDGRVLTKIKKVLSFDEHVRVTFQSGKQTVYCNDKIRFEKSC